MKHNFFIIVFLDPILFCLFFSCLTLFLIYLSPLSFFAYSQVFFLLLSLLSVICFLSFCLLSHSSEFLDLSSASASFFVYLLLSFFYFRLVIYYVPLLFPFLHVFYYYYYYYYYYYSLSLLFCIFYLPVSCLPFLFISLYFSFFLFLTLFFFLLSLIILLESWNSITAASLFCLFLYKSLLSLLIRAHALWCLLNFYVMGIWCQYYSFYSCNSLATYAALF